MGGDADWKKPDFTRYKVENIEQLRDLQRRLQAEGLKDPWLRNYAWRFMTPHYKIRFTNFWKHPGFFRGVGFGIAFMALFMTADQAYGFATGRQNDKGHH